MPRLFYEPARNDGAYTFQRESNNGAFLVKATSIFSPSGAMEISTYKVAWQLTVAIRGLALLSVWAWVLESCMIIINY